MAEKKEKKEKKEDNSIPYAIIAESIHDAYNVIHCYGSYHSYKNGVYVPNDKNIERAIKRRFYPTSTKQKVDQVLYNLRIDRAQDEESLNPYRYINLKNGLYDLEEDRLVEHRPDVLSTIQYPVVYKPNLSDKGLRMPSFCDETFPLPGTKRLSFPVLRFLSRAWLQR